MAYNCVLKTNEGWVEAVVEINSNSIEIKATFVNGILSGNSEVVYLIPIRDITKLSIGKYSTFLGRLDEKMGALATLGKVYRNLQA